MELKPYRQSVINDLKSYLEKLEEKANGKYIHPFVADNGKFDLDDIIPERVIAAEPTFIDRITQDAIKQASEYNITVTKEITSSNRSFFLPDEINEKVKRIEINMNYKDRIIDIRLPRFYLKEEGGIGLFSDG